MLLTKGSLVTSEHSVVNIFGGFCVPRIRNSRVSCLHPGQRYPVIPVEIAIHSGTPAKQRALSPALVICVGLRPRSHPLGTNTRAL